MYGHPRDVEVESERVYVVYDGKTGAIAHVHRVLTHRGATPAADGQGEARALEMANRFGHGRDATYQACTGGRSWAHGCASSSWAAMRSNRSSRKWAATNCTPTGKPSGVQCSGRLTAG